MAGNPCQDGFVGTISARVNQRKMVGLGMP